MNSPTLRAIAPEPADPQACPNPVGSKTKVEPSGFNTRAGRMVKAVDRFMSDLNVGFESFFPYKYEPQVQVV